MNLVQEQTTFVERDTSSPIRSHQSHDSQVAGICHHSGRYLRRDEINPIPFLHWLLLEQHDFPGLRRLDDAFANAAHAEEHQHVVYSRATIQGIALMVSAGLAMLALFLLFWQQDFVPRSYWFIYLGGLLLVFMACVAALGWAWLLIFSQKRVFHQQAKDLPPAIADYPVMGKYHVTAQETIQVDLDNLTYEQPSVSQHQGKLMVAVEPTPNYWESYGEYRQQYENHAVGEMVHAGAIALDGLQHVAFEGDVLEFEHRFVLRKATSEIGIDGQQGEIRPFSLSTSYNILPGALYPKFNGLERFPLECEPKLARLDSRTLELRFRWHGSGANSNCRLDECILDIPDELAPVTKVSFGRYDRERNQVIWRNRTFKQQTLVLTISFENPILSCLENLCGRFRFSVDDLLSGMLLSKAHVWTALGSVAPEENVEIERKTAVSGSLTLNPQRLSQEHEHVRQAHTIERPQPPDDELVDAVLTVLLREGFDLQRITQATPRLDTSGRLDSYLHYWDIIGRRYIPDLLDALDIHAVISGTSANGPGEQQQPYTNIDLRVRCLHDPRNRSTPQAVDTLIGTPQNGLAARIERELDSRQNKGNKASANK